MSFGLESSLDFSLKPSFKLSLSEKNSHLVYCTVTLKY